MTTLNESIVGAAALEWFLAKAPADRSGSNFAALQPSSRPPPNSEIIFHQTEDGRARAQCRFEDETLWLTQVQIAELFQTTVPNINLHLKAIYAEGEFAAEATIKSHLMVRLEGSRQVTRAVRHYTAFP